MASLSLRHINKVYKTDSKKGGAKEKPAVCDFNLEIEDKEFIVFVGPSGCGKSTTLRMIAGLEDITSGELYIDGRLVNDVEPKDRDIAMVFQNYALYPHMNVYANMAFSLKMRKIPVEVEKTDKNGNKYTVTKYKKMSKEEIDQKVKSAAKILDIEEYLKRKPGALSGGQRQRVALGRAIVRDPKVFLLDEPLSNLDAKLRSAMRTEITKLHKKLETTFIYVTHDQVEAMTMGTRIVVMKDGYVQQIGKPKYIYDHPVNKFVAGFIGTPQMSFFSCTLNGGKLTLSNGAALELPQEVLSSIVATEDGMEVWLGVRSENVHLTTKDDKCSFKCNVQLLEELGSETILYGNLDLNETDKVVDGENSLKIVAKISPNANLSVGDVVDISFDIESLHLFDKQSENSLYIASQGDIVGRKEE
ncbi:MAG: ATP-binding cassette domain-containing protein [Clostridia bacterium]|nr:ATP-binding cassette domain-containing protein [Clostridia bacterium]